MEVASEQDMLVAGSADRRKVQVALFSVIALNQSALADQAPDNTIDLHTLSSATILRMAKLGPAAHHPEQSEHTAHELDRPP